MLSFENRAVGRSQGPRYLIVYRAEPLQRTDGEYKYYSTDMCMHLFCACVLVYR
jgi:hypothetical protein